MLLLTNILGAKTIFIIKSVYMPVLKKSSFMIVSLSRLDFSILSKYIFFIFFLNLVKYATHFTGQVKKKEKSRTNDASTHETVK